MEGGFPVGEVDGGALLAFILVLLGVFGVGHGGIYLTEYYELTKVRRVIHLLEVLIGVALVVAGGIPLLQGV